MNPAFKSAFQSIIAHHLAHYPGLTIDDVYKLVFQAAMGSEHAVVDADRVERRLRAEVETMVPAPDQPMIDPVSPDHQLVRVHLHPFTIRGGRLVSLADAFIETARAFKPSVAALSAYWVWLEEMAGAEDFVFPQDELKNYGMARRAQRFPAVHHSADYRRLYHPAYRVVLKDRIELPAN